MQRAGVSGAPRPERELRLPSWSRITAQAAANAIEAGFDGVEIHGANG